MILEMLVSFESEKHKQVVSWLAEEISTMKPCSEGPEHFHSTFEHMGDDENKCILRTTNVYNLVSYVAAVSSSTNGVMRPRQDDLTVHFKDPADLNTTLKVMDLFSLSGTRDLQSVWVNDGLQRKVRDYGKYGGVGYRKGNSYSSPEQLKRLILDVISAHQPQKEAVWKATEDLLSGYQQMFNGSEIAQYLTEMELQKTDTRLMSLNFDLV